MSGGDENILTADVDVSIGDIGIQMGDVCIALYKILVDALIYGLSIVFATNSC